IARLRRHDPRWRLTIVGDGPLRAELERQARASEIEFRGYVPSGPELWNDYRRSNVFLHVSLTEGLPQVLAEAQAAGLPIVATDVGGVAAALGQGDRALLVPPSDAAAAAQACERLRHEPELRAEFVRRGLEFARLES